MKFRTDFVTNSSNSSFLTFNIKNKKLYDVMEKMGLSFEGVDDGEFSDDMTIVLPSGQRAKIGDNSNTSFPYLIDYSSVSAWLAAILLWEVDDGMEKEDFSPFAEEIINLFNQLEITNLDWDSVESWSPEDLIEGMSKRFDQMDEHIESALIEHVYGYEGEVGPCIYARVEKGSRMFLDYTSFEDFEVKDINELFFAASGEMKYYENRDELYSYIRSQGGHVLDHVTKDTDYLICNDLDSKSSKMKSAKELGVPILPEIAFIKLFSDLDEFDDLPDEETMDQDEWEDAWDLTLSGNVLEFVVKYGTQPILMEVWENGQWVRKKE